MGVVLYDVKGSSNPRKCVCPRCGKDTGVVHLGAHKYAAICNTCKTFNVGLPDTLSACQVCESTDIRPTVVPPDMPLPKICQTCQEEIAASSETIRKGGILWRCEDCGNTGTVTHDHEIAIMMRDRMQCFAPEPCGAVLDKDICPVCNEQKETLQ
jgi:hypothetical protein